MRALRRLGCSDRNACGINLFIECRFGTGCPPLCLGSSNSALRRPFRSASNDFTMAAARFRRFERTLPTLSLVDPTAAQEANKGESDRLAPATVARQKQAPSRFVICPIQLKSPNGCVELLVGMTHDVLGKVRRLRRPAHGNVVWFGGRLGALVQTAKAGHIRANSPLVEANSDAKHG